MPFKTRVTELLGVEHPIVCGGMTGTGTVELCVPPRGLLGLAPAAARGPPRCRSPHTRKFLLASFPEFRARAHAITRAPRRRRASRSAVAVSEAGGLGMFAAHNAVRRARARSRGPCAE